MTTSVRNLESRPLNHPNSLHRTDISPATTDRRANNLDFIRFILASLVILSHSTQLIDGNSNREPLTRVTPDAIGSSAAPSPWRGFFLISGFLIVQSWLLTGDFFKYLQKRILRIYPGVFAASVLSIAIAGAFGAAHAASYLRSDGWSLPVVLL